MLVQLELDAAGGCGSSSSERLQLLVQQTGAAAERPTDSADRRSGPRVLRLEALHLQPRALFPSDRLGTES